MSLDRKEVCHILNNRVVCIESILKYCCAICYDRIIEMMHDELTQIKRAADELED